MLLRGQSPLANTFRFHSETLKFVLTHIRHFSHFCATPDQNCLHYENFWDRIVVKLVVNLQPFSEQATMWSNESNLIRNNVAHADWNFQLSLKIKKFLSGNFIFSWQYILEYWSDLDEKWFREVRICSFWGVLRIFDELVAKGLMCSM